MTLTSQPTLVGLSHRASDGVKKTVESVNDGLKNAVSDVQNAVKDTAKKMSDAAKPKEKAADAARPCLINGLSRL